MAVPSSVWSEMTTTSIDSRTRKLADNFSKNDALLYRLMKKGKIKTFDGGVTIGQELAYQENSTFTWFSGYDTVNVSQSDVFTTAYFPIKQASVAVTFSRLEQLQNSGKAKMIDLIDARVDNAEQTIKDNIAVGCYGDGTASGGKAIGGLNALVPPDPTSGTVGGINRLTWNFWRPQLYDFSVLSISPSATTIQAAMNSMYLSTSRGPDHVDLIVADNLYYSYYWASLQGNQRFVNEDMASAGFDNVRFMGADVVFDGGIGGGIDANTMFFLNTKYIHFRPHVDENFVSADPDRHTSNQLATVKLITWAGNMTISGSRFQGRIQA